MTGVFADTAFYIASLSPRDALAEQAAVYARLGTLRTVTTDYVLVEVANFFCRAGGRQLFVGLVAELRSDPLVTIVPASPDLFERAFQLFAARPDKDWSLTDCTSFVVMADAGLTDDLTADHHFEQAGFRPLLA